MVASSAIARPDGGDVSEREAAALVAPPKAGTPRVDARWRRRRPAIGGGRDGDTALIAAARWPSRSGRAPDRGQGDVDASNAERMTALMGADAAASSSAAAAPGGRAAPTTECAEGPPRGSRTGVHRPPSATSQQYSARRRAREPPDGVFRTMIFRVRGRPCSSIPPSWQWPTPLAAGPGDPGRVRGLAPASWRRGEGHPRNPESGNEVSKGTSPERMSELGLSRHPGRRTESSAS